LNLLCASNLETGGPEKGRNHKVERATAIGLAWHPCTLDTGTLTLAAAHQGVSGIDAYILPRLASLPLPGLDKLLAAHLGDIRYSNARLRRSALHLSVHLLVLVPDPDAIRMRNHVINHV
jgi:hypothetical protein